MKLPSIALPQHLYIILSGACLTVVSSFMSDHLDAFSFISFLILFATINYAWAIVAYRLRHGLFGWLQTRLIHFIPTTSAAVTARITVTLLALATLALYALLYLYIFVMVLKFGLAFYVTYFSVGLGIFLISSRQRLYGLALIVAGIWLTAALTIPATVSSPAEMAHVTFGEPFPFYSQDTSNNLPTTFPTHVDLQTTSYNLDQKSASLNRGMLGVSYISLVGICLAVLLAVKWAWKSATGRKT
jgi:hypothetical protein